MKLTPWMLTVAAFGIIAVLAVGFLFKKLLAAPVVEVKPPEARVVPMAITEIEPGTIITRAHLGNGRAKLGEKLAEDTLLSIDSIVGRITREKVTAAVPLRGSMFYAPGDFPGLQVTQGMQAVVVKVSETTAVLNKKMKPGQHVDVLLTVEGISSSGISRSPSRSGNSATDNDAMTVTLFKGVKILAMSHGYTPTAAQRDDSHNVTLELDEEQTRIVSLAQRKGEIDLVYSENGPGTGGIAIQASEKDRITLREILGLKDEKEKEKPFKTDHYRGSGRSSIYFDKEGPVSGPTIDDSASRGDTGADVSGGDASSQLQGTGNSRDDWSTDSKPADRRQNVTKRATTSSDL